jgi:hypothetical protein
MLSTRDISLRFNLTAFNNPTTIIFCTRFCDVGDPSAFWVPNKHDFLRILLDSRRFDQYSGHARQCLVPVNRIVVLLEGKSSAALITTGRNSTQPLHFQHLRMRSPSVDSASIRANTHYLPPQLPIQQPTPNSNSLTSRQNQSRSQCRLLMLLRKPQSVTDSPNPPLHLPRPTSAKLKPGAGAGRARIPHRGMEIHIDT